VTASRASKRPPRSLLAAEFAQPQFALVGDPDQDSRAAVAQRCALVIELQSARRHEVDQEGQLTIVPGIGFGRRTLPPFDALGSVLDAIVTLPPTSTSSILPIRRTPSSLRPTRASSGGLTVLSATMPGASADSISAPASAALRRHAVISTSGSSDMVRG